MSNQLSLKGYIHDTTAVLQSRNGSTQYFTFLFQINETQKRRAVCYDDSKHKLVENFQESKKPAHIINIKEKPSIFDAEEQHLILGKRSRIEPAALGDFRLNMTLPHRSNSKPHSRPLQKYKSSPKII